MTIANLVGQAGSAYGGRIALEDLRRERERQRWRGVNQAIAQGLQGLQQYQSAMDAKKRYEAEKAEETRRYEQERGDRSDLWDKERDAATADWMRENSSASARERRRERNQGLQTQILREQTLADRDKAREDKLADEKRTNERKDLEYERDKTAEKIKAADAHIRRLEEIKLTAKNAKELKKIELEIEAAESEKERQTRKQIAIEQRLGVERAAYARAGAIKYKADKVLELGHAPPRTSARGGKGGGEFGAKGGKGDKGDKGDKTTPTTDVKKTLSQSMADAPEDKEGREDFDTGLNLGKGAAQLIGSAGDFLSKKLHGEGPDVAEVTGRLTALSTSHPRGADDKGPKWAKAFIDKGGLKEIARRARNLDIKPEQLGQFYVDQIAQSSVAIRGDDKGIYLTDPRYQPSESMGDVFGSPLETATEYYKEKLPEIDKYAKEKFQSKAINKAYRQEPSAPVTQTKQPSQSPRPQFKINYKGQSVHPQVLMKLLSAKVSNRTADRQDIEMLRDLMSRPDQYNMVQ